MGMKVKEAEKEAEEREFGIMMFQKEMSIKGGVD